MIKFERLLKKKTKLNCDKVIKDMPCALIANSLVTTSALVLCLRSDVVLLARSLGDGERGSGTSL